MRFAQMCALKEMCDTLLEAAAYLSSRPGSSEGPELLSAGDQMLRLMEAELDRCREDLKSLSPLLRLEKLRALWPGQAPGLEEELRALARELPRELRYQIRALVVADQGSTWDAKESVYRFLRSDPRFDPVVVRIPVFRKHKTNGTEQEEIIYSDYLTPLGVPSVEFDRYSITEDRPDVVFTSQPYEGTIPGAYGPSYLSTLSKVVYLPYFTPDHIRDNVREYFDDLPAYGYSWKIVCSNQRVFDYFCRTQPELKEKLLLTGLPKLDGIVELSKAEAPLPAGWERLLGKKVILWNSWYTITASLKFVFMDVFNWCRAHPESALIWRPHPVTNTVTKFAFPDVYPAVLKFTEEMAALPNVIVDESPSFYPAFWYSDAMISDLSSMLPQYLLMDKPALAMTSSYWEDLGERFIDDAWLVTADVEQDPGAVTAFLEGVLRGEDPCREQRKLIRERDLPLADGHSGERVCEAVWDALHRENGMAPEAAYGC